MNRGPLVCIRIRLPPTSNNAACASSRISGPTSTDAGFWAGVPNRSGDMAFTTLCWLKSGVPTLSDLEKTERHDLRRKSTNRGRLECEARKPRQIVAVIGDSANIASIALHQRLGFVMVGTIRSAGYKFGRWVDTVLMQRSLGAGDSPPPC